MAAEEWQPQEWNAVVESFAGGAALAVGQIFEVAGVTAQLGPSATNVIGLAQFELLPVTFFRCSCRGTAVAGVSANWREMSHVKRVWLSDHKGQ